MRRNPLKTYWNVYTFGISTALKNILLKTYVEHRLSFDLQKLLHPWNIEFHVQRMFWQSCLWIVELSFFTQRKIGKQRLGPWYTRSIDWSRIRLLKLYWSFSAKKNFVWTVPPSNTILNYSFHTYKFELQCPPLIRITLGPHISDNNNWIIQSTEVIRVLFI